MIMLKDNKYFMVYLTFIFNALRLLFHLLHADVAFQFNLASYQAYKLQW